MCIYIYNKLFTTNYALAGMFTPLGQIIRFNIEPATHPQILSSIQHWFQPKKQGAQKRGFFDQTVKRKINKN
jgi:hypothetical protein